MGSATDFRQWMRIALVYAVVVILFGAFVRASLSGDGCGVSWPTCGGSLLPDTSQAKTIIEFTHRVTSGLLGLLVAGLYVAMFRKRERGDAMRRATGWALISVIVSALIGAVLVREGWVVHDKSMARALFMPVHLVNNYILLGALGLADWYARGNKPLRKGTLGERGLLATIAGASLALGITGAISAMGKTAFTKELQAAQTFTDRLDMHVGEAAHPFLKGGVAHPLLATSLFVLMIWACGYLARTHSSPAVQRWSKYVSYGIVGQMLIGVLNLAISAPAWMQMIHLAVALGLVIGWTELAAHTLSESEAPVRVAEEPQAEPAVRPDLRTTINAYIALTKPRVISLLIFTTTAAQVIAAQSWPGWALVGWVALGGYMMAGAANTINMLMERDLDQAMERTSHRPTITHVVPASHAAVFAGVMMVGSFALLSLTANVLAAALALAGLLFYVFVYTLLLKRRTWQNIVIGGAAGAFPPLVGWASVTGDLNWFAWVLFAIIFLWTPVHFWALAILIKDDYAKAGVPMLPVVRGDHVTAVQIMLYAGLTAVVSLVPLITANFSIYTLGLVTLLNVGLIAQSLGLLRHTERPQAKSLFKYSMLYLALFFLIVAVDRTV